MSGEKVYDWGPPCRSLGVMAQVLSAAVEGVSILELCELGDRLILEETSKVYKKEKELKKGTVPSLQVRTT